MNYLGKNNMKYLYAFLKYFNDAKAVKNGRVAKRIGWRISGKTSSKLFNGWFK